MKKLLYSAVILVMAVVLSAMVFTACDKPAEDVQTLRFVAPDGATALIFASLLKEQKTVSGYKIAPEIVSPALIAGEMAKGSADLIIMPTNAGANLIVNKGAQYKLVSANAMGLLYLVGKTSGNVQPQDLIGKTVASIGQANTPQHVLTKVLNASDVGINAEGVADDSKVTVRFYADASAVKAALDSGVADYGLVGEPAATNMSARYPIVMDMQEAWKCAVGGTESYPQASLFVKAELLEAEFIGALLDELSANLDFISQNAEEVNSLLKNAGSTATFSAASIARCNIGVTKAVDAKASVNTYLKAVMNADMPDSLYYLP